MSDREEKMKRFLGIGIGTILILAIILLAGCGGGGGSTTTTTSTTSAAPTEGTPAFTAATVAKGQAYKLVFLTQPQGGKAFENFSVLPVVGIQDTEGNIVTSADLRVSISITPATAGSSPMAGTMVVSAVNGIATFTRLDMEGSGQGFVMVAKASGLLDAFSQPFDVSD
jgi:hypothetical protein